MSGEPHSLVGRVLGERYLIEAPLAEGPYSRLYIARHRELGRRFAIKMLADRSDSSLRVRFTQEARVAGKLLHPNVVGACDFGHTEAGDLYLVMDYVDGRTLLDVIAEEAPLSPGRVLDLTRKLCRGLAHIHGHGLIHRDLKPANVVIDAAGEPRILDFGIAVAPGGGDCGARVTSHGLIVGTPHYVSPEQAYGLPLDPRTDLFSLGLVVFEMLTGELPFDGDTAEIVRQNATVAAPRVSARHPSVRIPAELERLVATLLQRHRGRRPASAQAVIEELDRIESAGLALTSIALAPPSRRARILRRAACGLLAATASLGLVALPWALSSSDTGTGGAAASAPLALAGDRTPGSGAPASGAAGAPAARDAGPKRVDSGAGSRSAGHERRAGEPERASRRRRARRGHRHLPPAVGVSAGRLAKRYRVVGAGIGRLAATFGESAIGDLRRRFFALPYAEALRSPKARGAVLSELAKLGADVARRRAILRRRRSSAALERR